MPSPKAIDELLLQYSFKEADQIILKNFINFLQNQLVKTDSLVDTIIPYGLLIQSEDENQSIEFLKNLNNCISATISQSPYTVFYGSVNDIEVFRKRKYKPKETPIWAFTNFELGGNIDQVYSLFKSTPEIIKIVFASEETIHTHISTNDDFYYRVLPRHIQLNSSQPSAICERFIKDFTSQYNVTEDFKSELLFYIETIYETADYKETDFIQDLKQRILRQMKETAPLNEFLSARSIDSTFVPYSEKVTKRKEALNDLKTLETPAPTKSKWLPEIDRRSDLPVSGTTAIILLFLSDYRDSVEYSYSAPNSSTYYGIQTADAPLQYLIDCAIRDGASYCEILCVTSHKVATTPCGNQGETAYKRLEQLVQAIMGDHGHVSLIRYNYTENMAKLTSSGSISNNLFRQLKEVLAPYHSANAYIEYTGGLRDTGFLLTSIVRYLEFSGLNCHEISYSNFNDKSITNLHYIYNLYQIINGTSEFLEYGNSTQLLSAFPAPSEAGSASKLLQSIQQFSNAISVCALPEIDKSLKQVAYDIDHLNVSDNDIAFSLLRNLIPTIKERLHLQDMVSVRNQKTEIYYPVLIKWCVDHNLLQQAITLYIEKMPIYYFQWGIIPENFIPPAENYDRYGKEYTDFYTGLYDFIFQRCDTSMKLFADELNQALKPYKPLSSVTQYYSILNRLSRQNHSFSGAYLKLANLIKEVPLGVKNVDIEIYGKKWNIINNLSPVISLRLLHYLIYNNPEDYARYENISGSKHTYEKKYKALHVLTHHEIPISILNIQNQNRLEQIMLYYLAIKLLRNRMNHASEEELSPDEKWVIQELERQYSIKVEHTVGSIRQLLNNALSFNFILEQDPISIASSDSSINLSDIDSKKVPANDEASEETSAKWSSVEISDLTAPSEVNKELLKKYLQMIVIVFMTKNYPENKIDWNQLQEDLTSLYGNDVPDVREINQVSGITKPKYKSLKLVCGFSSLFSKEENPKDSGNPIVVYNK